MWPDRRILDLFGVELPILQAPMAGASDVDLAIAVARAGGLGALPAGMLSGEQVRAQVEQFRGRQPADQSQFPRPQNAGAQQREGARVAGTA